MTLVNGKVALVTGASSGIGEATALKLQSLGYTVYGTARRVERMAGLADRGIHTLAMDVTDEASMHAGVQQIIAAEGRIDVLVNSAGYSSYGAIEDVPIAEARRQFEVNLFGVARLSQLVLPAMRAARSGMIVNISSMSGRIWTPIGSWYDASKHALEVLSDALRVETRPFGIQVVVVQPGAIKSEWAAIAAEHLMATSKGSAYKAQTDAVAQGLRNVSGASPEVVAATVSRAVRSTRPRRRYAVTRDAKASIFLHWLLPTGAWESLIGLIIRTAARMASKGPASVSQTSWN
jgi:NAD(P)-dependent dehydrogenase (short-subunit alcohol dehydrogenase family)